MLAQPQYRSYAQSQGLAYLNPKCVRRGLAFRVFLSAANVRRICLGG